MTRPPVCPHCQHTMVVSARSMPDGNSFSFWRCNCPELPLPDPAEKPKPVERKLAIIGSLGSAGQNLLCPFCKEPMTLENTDGNIGQWACNNIHSLTEEQLNGILEKAAPPKHGASCPKAKAKVKAKAAAKSLPAPANRVVLQITDEVDALRHLFRLLHIVHATTSDAVNGSLSLSGPAAVGKTGDPIKDRYVSWLTLYTVEANTRRSTAELAKLVTNLRAALRIPLHAKIESDYAFADPKDPTAEFVRAIIAEFRNYTHDKLNHGTTDAELCQTFGETLGIEAAITACFEHALWRIPGTHVLFKLDELPRALSRNEHWRKTIGA